MVKKIATTFGTKMLIAILNLTIVVILSRYLGAEGKGEASLVITSIAMILLFSNIIGGSTLVYFVPRYNVKQLFFLSNAWSILTCLCSYVLLVQFTLIHSNIVWPVIGLSLINSFIATNLTILLGKEKITSHNMVSLLQVIINMVVLYFLFDAWGEVNIHSYITSLFIAMGTCLAISTLLILPYLTKDNNKKEKHLFIKLSKNGLASQAGHIMKFMSFRFTYYLLVAFSGEVALGVFSNGVSLIESTFLICNSIATFLYPKVANSTNINYSRKLTLVLAKACIVLCVLTLIPLVLLPSSFYVWLFGAEFEEVNYVIRLLAPGILFYNIALVIGHYFSGIGKFKINTYGNLIGLLTTIVLVACCYPHLSISWISIISTLSYVTTSVFIIYCFIKDAKIKGMALFPGWNDYKWLMKNVKKIRKS